MIHFVGATRYILFLKSVERAVQIPQELVMEQDDQVYRVIAGDPGFAIRLKSVHGYLMEASWPVICARIRGY